MGSRPDRRTDKSPYTYKYGKFVGSRKHNPNSKGIASYEPIAGQRALDNSITWKGSSTGRVGVSEGQIVRLYMTEDGEYHGVPLTREELSQLPIIKKALVREKLINNLGRILEKCDEQSWFKIRRRRFFAF